MSLVNADIAASLAESARAINAPQTLEETLDAIVRATLVSVPGFDHVGISIMHRDGTIQTKAATDQVVWELDDLQYSIDEGPCVSAMREGQVMAVPNIRHEQRWSRYVPEAVMRTGLQAQLAVQLYTTERVLGGLNLYSTTSASIDPARSSRLSCSPPTPRWRWHVPAARLTSTTRSPPGRRSAWPSA